MADPAAAASIIPTAFDYLIIAATLLSPLIAVQVTRYFDRGRHAYDEQMRVFQTLMATRASGLDARHVEALNVIDVVFARKTAKHRAIRDAWKAHLHHLGRSPINEAWQARRTERLIDLLYAMAQQLGFDYDKTHLATQIYFPTGWGDQLADQERIRRGLARIAAGEEPLRVSVSPGLGGLMAPTSNS